MRSQFTLFQSHIDLAHKLWSQIVQPGDTVVDATCGNGHDTLYLCHTLFSQQSSPIKGKVIAFDIDPKATNNTTELLSASVPQEWMNHITVETRCHTTFPDALKNNKVKLIVYNLGYLPGGDKKKTTETKTTLLSLEEGQKLLINGGVISLTLYPGHEEGKKEAEALMQFAKTLSPFTWSASTHAWCNRKDAPQLLILQKSTLPLKQEIFS